MSYKICIYAICKNESKFVDRWYNSIKEADYIVVLDTGSTDNTVELLKKYEPHIQVYEKIINPWRFDTARNESLKYVPKDTDICVVSDFDQVFRPGWADDLRKLFSEGYQEVFGDIIDYDDNNKEIKRFLSKNVHPNDMEHWFWERPIHEGIFYHGEGNPKSIISNKFIIEHHPDRSKSRDGYLTLLETEYKENSSDPMCAIYYGCELFFHNKNEESLEVFLKAIDECDFSNDSSVGYQMYLNVASLYNIKGDTNMALNYAMGATKFNINTRKLWMSFADIYEKKGDYVNTIKYIEKALSVTNNARGWIEDDRYWKYECYDRMALNQYACKNYLEAISYGSIALSIDPENDRLKNNLQSYMKAFKGGEIDE